MPTRKEIAEEIWLHLNAPEELDKRVATQIARFKREARLDELSDYQNERKAIDDEVDRYMNAETFEKHKHVFLQAERQDLPELEAAADKIVQELRYSHDTNSQTTPTMSDKDREQHISQVSARVDDLSRNLTQEIVQDEPKHEL